MVKEKRMDQSDFATILKEKTALAESIRAHQEEKQSVIDRFNDQVRMYRTGRISKTALSASIPKVRKEFQRLDKAIRADIKSIGSVSRRAAKFAERQTPFSLIISTKGVHRSAKRKATRRKATRRSARRTTARRTTARRARRR